MDITSLLERNPIIAAIHHSDFSKEAVSSQSEVIFLLSANILQIADLVQFLREQKKIVFVHADLIEGLGKDSTSVEYISKKIKPDGILSTKGNVLKRAKELGLITVQRIFLLDSRALNSGVEMIKQYNPDFVEVMPGLIPRGISELRNRIKQPIIAGGMITSKEDVISALKAGALAVSTSRRELWDL